MKISIECQEPPDPVFQVYRAKWAELAAKVFMLAVDFSQRVEPAGVTHEGKKMGLLFDFEGTNIPAATVWLRPEGPRERQLSEYGRMNKKTYYAVLIPRDAHLDIKLKMFHEEQVRL